MGKKTKISALGQGEEWGEPKNTRLNLKVTQTCKSNLEALATQNRCSITELIERWSRGILPSSSVESTARLKPLTFADVLRELHWFSVESLLEIAASAIGLVKNKPRVIRSSKSAVEYPELITKLFNGDPLDSLEALKVSKALDIPIEQISSVVQLIHSNKEANKCRD
jgi:hypothetical protein